MSRVSFSKLDRTFINVVSQMDRAEMVKEGKLHVYGLCMNSLTKAFDEVRWVKGGSIRRRELKSRGPQEALHSS